MQKFATRNRDLTEYARPLSEAENSRTLATVQPVTFWLSPAHTLPLTPTSPQIKIPA